ncbi:unnamed protein product [Urochloa humidicola]
MYSDMYDFRMAIAEMREFVGHNQDVFDKLIQTQIEAYQDLRNVAKDLRDKIRKMANGGQPFEEPEGFDIMP